MRDILKDPGVELSAEGEALLFAAARAELVRQVIAPAARRGPHGGLRPLPGLVAGLPGRGARARGRRRSGAINEPAVAGLRPDLTVLLAIDAADAAGRGAEDDRFEREGAQLQRAVAEAYDELAAAEPGRWRRVDAARDPEAVHRDVLAAVQEAAR